MNWKPLMVDFDADRMELDLLKDKECIEFVLQD